MSINSVSTPSLPPISAEARDIQAQLARLAKDKKQLGKLAQEFESVFLELVMKNMRNTVQKSELIDGGNGEDIFRDLLDGEYAKSMAGQGNSGVGESIEKQLVSVINEQTKALERRLGQVQYGEQALRHLEKQAKIPVGPIKNP
jgi:flagellar protein FlgJ